MTLIRMNNVEDLEKIIPEESKEYPGYYYFPDNRKIALSRDGKVINTKTGKILVGYKNSTNNSWQFSISESGSKIITYRLPRVIGRTFVGRPSRHLNKKYSELEINHIDGNRDNNSSDNLEWITAKENVLHAHLSNFHPSDKIVIAKHLFTGEVLKFNSTKSCADFFKIHRATFWRHLNDGSSGKFHKDRFIFKYSDDSEWIQYPLTNIKEIGSNNSPVDIIVKDENNYVISIFSNIKECAATYGVPHVTLWRNLKRQGKYIFNKLIFSLHNPSKEDVCLTSNEIVTI